MVREHAQIQDPRSFLPILPRANFFSLLGKKERIEEGRKISKEKVYDQLITSLQFIYIYIFFYIFQE